ncbi:hypothetical protein AGMMS4956_03640 [Bacteroidia bacterium]|nr:hypothetical protein AGMMS4956_03640 [Bacteroidia bacterium]
MDKKIKENSYEQNKHPYSSGLPKVHASFDTTKYISDMREDKELV